MNIYFPAPYDSLYCTYFMDPASDPEEGSVKQNAANSPDVTLGKYFAFCSGVPNNNIPLKPIDWCAPRVIPTPK